MLRNYVDDASKVSLDPGYCKAHLSVMDARSGKLKIGPPGGEQNPKKGKRSIPTIFTETASFEICATPYTSPSNNLPSGVPEKEC